MIGLAADAEVSKLILQVLGVILGGGALQLIIPLVKRRSELRKTTSEADSVIVESANKQVLRLEVELERVGKELMTVKDELSKERAAGDARIMQLQKDHLEAMAASQRRFNATLLEFQDENERLNRHVTKLQLDLSRANATIQVLKTRQE